MDIDVKV